MSGYRERQAAIRRYTVPKKRFQYQQIGFDEYMNYMKNGDNTLVKRSSFIPYTVANEEIFLILGSFWDYPRQILTDFGGSCQFDDKKKINLSPLGCATKELHEESKGLLTRPILGQLGTASPDDFQIYKGRSGREIIYFVLVPLARAEAERLVRDINQKDYKAERLGPVDFYSEADIVKRKYLTANYLTDFIDYLYR